MSKIVTTLPHALIKSHREWRGNRYEKALYAKLAIAQEPLAMIISCCDSRVDPDEIFGVPAGTLFTLRNIANLVPTYGTAHSVTATLEYAIDFLKVPHLMVMGHSNCGGVYHGYHIHSGNSQVPDDSSVYHWLDAMRPAYKNLNKDGDSAAKITMLEKLSVQVSLDNLAAYPIVDDAMKKNALQLHGLWHDIPSGHLHYYNPASGEFESIT